MERSEKIKHLKRALQDAWAFAYDLEQDGGAQGVYFKIANRRINSIIINVIDIEKEENEK